MGRMKSLAESISILIISGSCICLCFLLTQRESIRLGYVFKLRSTLQRMLQVHQQEVQHRAEQEEQQRLAQEQLAKEDAEKQRLAEIERQKETRRFHLLLANKTGTAIELNLIADHTTYRQNLDAFSSKNFDFEERPLNLGYTAQTIQGEKLSWTKTITTTGDNHIGISLTLSDEYFPLWITNYSNTAIVGVEINSRRYDVEVPSHKVDYDAGVYPYFPEPDLRLYLSVGLPIDYHKLSFQTRDNIRYIALTVR